MTRRHPQTANAPKERMHPDMMRTRRRNRDRARRLYGPNWKNVVRGDAPEARIGRDGVVVHAGDTIECPNGCRHVVDRIHWRDGEAFMVVGDDYLSEHLRVRVVDRAAVPEAKPVRATTSSGVVRITSPEQLTELYGWHPNESAALFARSSGSRWIEKGLESGRDAPAHGRVPSRRRDGSRRDWRVEGAMTP